MLINDANGKHPVAPGVLYVIHEYVYKKIIMIAYPEFIEPTISRAATGTLGT